MVTRRGGGEGARGGEGRWARSGRGLGPALLSRAGLSAEQAGATPEMEDVPCEILAPDACAYFGAERVYALWLC